MSMNFTIKLNVCPHCLKGSETLHIGHLTTNWPFALNIFPQEGILNLDDWEMLFLQNNVRIEDEQQNLYSPRGMISKIKGEDRKGVPMRQREIGKECIAHGENGLYDLVDGNERKL